MKIRITLGVSALVAAAIVAGQLNESQALADRGGAAGTTGADVAICTLPGSNTYPRVGDIHSFSFGTNSFNNGDEILQWIQNTNNHPVIAQNMYRVKDGRIEMIGMAWLKHGFCALQNAGCGSCQSCGFGCPPCLGPGCADPYSAGLNGSQANLGPRSEVNASNGFFLWPYNLAWQQTGNGIYKRLQVHDDDLNPALNSGAQYYIEGHYVHPQEGTTDLRHNNASYKRVNLSASGNSYNLTGNFPTSIFLPAIYAWQEVHPDVEIKPVDVPGLPVDGRFHLGYRVIDNGDGTWRYEYALHNLNSHRSASGFSVPLPDNVNVLSTHYRDVKYHSGEMFTNEDWTLNVGGGAVSWNGVEFSVNPNANALRWSSTFSFGFVADSPPTTGEVQIDLFRPGTVDAVAVVALVPGDIEEPCVGDITGSGAVGVDDLLLLLADWGDCSDPQNCPADLTGDSTVGVDDLLALLANWGECE